jgi:GntR family transcriptional regulator, transcriptional repressor for pyruvate dehydrogenase complex
MAGEPQALRDAISPLKSARKSDEVFDQIARFIRSGRFQPGTKLPPERELATLFNTSRPTVREALYRAELVGLIEVRHGAGSYVMAAQPREAMDRPIIDLIKKEAHRISEFFEIRRALEGWCAAQAAKVATRKDLKEMKSRLDRMKGLDVTGEEWERNDIAFHQALAASTGNPIAIRIMGILRDGFSAFYRFKRFVPNREEQELIWQHHADIYEAVKRKSAVDARAAIIAHMDFIESRLGESMRVMQRRQKGR